VEDGRVYEKNKFAIILNVTCPDDPMLFALATSNVGFYQSTSMWDAHIIRVAIGTYKFLTKDTVLSFRQIHKESLEELRKQYSEKELTLVGDLLRVHMDQVDKIIASSVLIEGWKKKRCTVPSA
jgi:hypothetical protein